MMPFLGTHPAKDIEWHLTKAIHIVLAKVQRKISILLTSRTLNQYFV